MGVDNWQISSWGSAVSRVARALLPRRLYLLRPVRHALEVAEAHLQNEVDQGHFIKIDFAGEEG